MISRQVRNGYVLHLPKGVMVKGPAEVKVKSPNEFSGQEYKLEPVVVTKPISPQPTVAAIEEPVAERPIKRKRGQRGRSRIRKDD